MISRNFKWFIVFLLFWNSSIYAFSNEELQFFEYCKNNNVEAVKKMLNKNPGYARIRSSDTSPLLISAAKGYYDIVDLLLSNGADVNFKNTAGVTALDVASIGLCENELKDNYRNILKLLINNGANVNTEFKLKGNSFNALVFVLFAGCKDLAELFIKKGAKIDYEFSDGRTALSVVSYDRCKEAVLFLVERGAKIGKDVFCEAIAGGNCEIIELFIKKGVSVNGYYFGTPFIVYAVEEFDAYRYDVTKLLINYGADVNAVTKDGFTALMSAERFEQYQVMELLLKKGAKVNVKNNVGQTVLMLASRDDQYDMAKLLIKYGADVNIRDNNGKTALTYALEKYNSDIADLLLENGAHR